MFTRCSPTSALYFHPFLSIFGGTLRLVPKIQICISLAFLVEIKKLTPPSSRLHVNNNVNTVLNSTKQLFKVKTNTILIGEILRLTY
jgi:hypothetical protein